MKSFYNITLIIFYFLIFLIKSQPKNDNIIDLDLTFHDTGRKSQTIILNDYNFDSLVQNGNLNRWLVIFFSETSSFCKQIKSIIDKIIEEKKYKKINNIKFGSMDIDNNLQSLIRFNITGVPYIIIVENNKMTQFQMFPIEQNIINFIETEIDEFIDMKDFIKQLSLFEFIRDLSIFTLRYYVEKINSFLNKKKINVEFNIITFLLFTTFFISSFIILFMLCIIKCFCNRKIIKKKDTNKDKKIKNNKEDEINKEDDINNEDNEEIKKKLEEKKEKEMKEKEKKENKSNNNDDNKKKEKKKKKE